MGATIVYSRSCLRRFQELHVHDLNTSRNRGTTVEYNDRGTRRSAEYGGHYLIR